MLQRWMLALLGFVALGCGPSATEKVILSELATIRSESAARHAELVERRSAEDWQVATSPKGEVFVLRADQPNLLRGRRNESGKLTFRLVVPPKPSGPTRKESESKEPARKHVSNWRLVVDAQGTPYVHDSVSGLIYEGIKDQSDVMTLQPVSMLMPLLSAVLGEPIDTNRADTQGVDGTGRK